MGERKGFEPVFGSILVLLESAERSIVCCLEIFWVISWR